MSEHPKLTVLLLLVPTIVAGCTASGGRPLLSSHRLPDSGETTVLVAPWPGLTTLVDQARQAGLAVEGWPIVSITGEASRVAALTVESEARPSTAVADEVLFQPADESFEAQPEALVIAKEEFGLIDFWSAHPEADGRDVKVGVVDDGVSPTLPGLSQTSTGSRKYLDHHSRSTSFDVELSPVAVPAELAPLAEDGSTTAYGGEVTEVRTTPERGRDIFDLNGNRRQDTFRVLVLEQPDGARICVDLDQNRLFAPREECVGDFAATGQYLFWDRGRQLVLLANYDLSTHRLTLHPGEAEDDDHAEGVASILLGYRMADRFSGIAPGAELLDYDVAVPSFWPEENQYTIDIFLKALEWLGSQGAEVVNISYYLYFFSPESQEFMADALQTLVDQYNFVVCFSAGNDGPALGSFRRGLVYPNGTVVAGAYASQKLSELVHGVTGVPAEGRVTRYSSRGPGPDGGSAPTVLSPMASVVPQPGGGYRAFSGTSAAAPAVAGFAAVLLSRIKQLGLPVDGPAVAHAIRRSGRPLAGIPFLEQGTGVPQIEEALERYRRIIEGCEFQEIVIELEEKTYSGASKARGVLLKASDQLTNRELLIRYQGEVSQDLPRDVAGNLLQTFRIETNVPWLQGPRRAVVSTGQGEMYILLDLSLLENPQPGGEYFGEIRFVDEATNLIVQVIPVTYLHDLSVIEHSPQIRGVTLGPEEGRRYHFFVPPGVQGLAYRSRVTNGPNHSVEVGIIAPNGRAVGSSVPNDVTVFADAAQSGWYQAIFTRRGGSSAMTSLETTIEAVQLHVLDQALEIGGTELLVDNRGSAMDFVLEIRQEPTVIHRGFAPAYLTETVRHEVPLRESGPFVLRVGTATGTTLTDWRYSCLVVAHDPAGAFVFKSWLESPDELTLKIDEATVGGNLSLQCVSFEHNALLPSVERLVWSFELVRPTPEPAVWASASDRVGARTRRNLLLRWEDAAEIPAGPAGVYALPRYGAASALRVGTVELVDP